MKMLPTFASLLGLAAALGTASAQTPATATSATPTAAKTADKRAATYKGPKVVPDTKALGHKMLHDSKPIIKPASPPASPIKE